jgi:hypothetical protein
MSNRPSDNIAVSLEIVFAPLDGSEDTGNVSCDRRFFGRTAMVLDSIAFIRSSVYRLLALNRRWHERNTSAQQHRHDARFDHKVGTCPSSRFYVQVDWICKHWPTYRN